MSPTVFRVGRYRFYFNSREETRMHVHVQCSDGEAKFWLEPIVALDRATGLRSSELKIVSALVEDRKDEITQAWKDHFAGLAR